jgi:hypothetical protein
VSRRRFCAIASLPEHSPAGFRDSAALVGALRDRDFGDGDVHRAVLAAAGQVIELDRKVG